MLLKSLADFSLSHQGGKGTAIADPKSYETDRIKAASERFVDESPSVSRWVQRVTR